MAKKKVVRLDRLDKHSFWLKIAALFAKSLCVVPILNFILLIYALVMGGHTEPEELAAAQKLMEGGNLTLVGFFYLICVPALIWGFFLYYFDALFKVKKKLSGPLKVICSVVVYILLGSLNVLLLWVVYRQPLIMGLAFLSILLFAFWGYEASVKSYSEVLSTKTTIVIACIYIFYLMASAFISIANSSVETLNGEPVVLGVVFFGALSFVVMNQASIDYEMQNRDAESSDARRGIQVFNFRVSLILVAVLALLYFTRTWIASFLTWLLKVLQQTVSAIVNFFGGIGDVNFDDVSKDFEVSVSHGDENNISSDVMFNNPQLIFFIMLAIVIALLIVFRKPILKAMRKAVKFFSKLFQFKTYTAHGTSQYYRDLVEEIDEDEANRLFAASMHTKRNNKAMLKEYDKLREPNQRVRRALPVMRTLFSTAAVEFADGDTARDITRRIDGESVPLKEYTGVYEAVRYDAEDASPAEGEAAAALVHGAYEQVKAYKPPKPEKK